MSIRGRVALLVVILGVALAAQFALFGYLQAAGPLPSVALAKPLTAFPLQFDSYSGDNLPITDSRVLYGDEFVSRAYRCGDRKHDFWLWMVYSASGEDRGHHPEVCMHAAGMPEDPGGRAAVSAEGHSRPIQQYCFGRAGGGESLLVYYWHYTLTPSRDEQIGPLRRAYQQWQRRPSSLTIEVFTQSVANDDAEAAQQFVRAVDRAIQAFLPPGAARGSARLPVFLVTEGGVRAG
jgi:hypothetical protein